MKTKSDYQMKKDLLAEAQHQGRVQFKRVGQPILERVRRRMDEAYWRILKGEVQTHPSKGVTLK